MSNSVRFYTGIDLAGHILSDNDTAVKATKKNISYRLVYANLHTKIHVASCKSSNLAPQYRQLRNKLYTAAMLLFYVL
jgi:hypothetical protein